ncbi:hypothetical protein [Rathayibacter sp. AY1D1]|uniref:hypothetical protein n=1 Tax=Rathayibacter sp. AY1D1 TaxID=2080542 RepID=UPI0011B08F69|nr:hypothetical protein [Rathayibacter sp. AY1D1]
MTQRRDEEVNELLRAVDTLQALEKSAIKAGISARIQFGQSDSGTSEASDLTRAIDKVLAMKQFSSSPHTEPELEYNDTPDDEYSSLAATYLLREDAIRLESNQTFRRRYAGILTIIGAVSAGIGLGAVVGLGDLVNSYFALLATVIGLIYASIGAFFTIRTDSILSLRLFGPSRVDRNVEVLQEWLQIEGQLRRIGQRHLGKLGRGLPVGSILRKLEQNRVLSKVAVEELTVILRLRNKAAHGGNTSPGDLRKMHKALQVVRPSLKSALRSNATPVA